MANFLDLIKGEGPAVTFIKSLVNTDRSAASILSALRDNGLGIRTQTGYQVINYLRDTFLPSQEYIKSTPADQILNIARIPKSVTKLLRNFSYQLSFTGISRLTGETLTNYLTVSSNQLLTKQQAIDAAYGMLSNAEFYEALDNGELNVDEVIQNNDGITF